MRYGPAYEPLSQTSHAPDTRVSCKTTWRGYAENTEPSSHGMHRPRIALTWRLQDISNQICSTTDTRSSIWHLRMSPTFNVTSLVWRTLLHAQQVLPLWICDIATGLGLQKPWRDTEHQDNWRRECRYESLERAHCRKFEFEAAAVFYNVGARKEDLATRYGGQKGVYKWSSADKRAVG